MSHMPVLEATSLPADAIEVGRIADAWGIKGWFKVMPSAAPRGPVCRQGLVLQPAEKAPSISPAPCCCPSSRRASLRHHRGHLRQVADRNAAEALRGARVFVARGLSRPRMASSTGWI
jgi:16S rRNA processing protein RimM